MSTWLIMAFCSGLIAFLLFVLLNVRHSDSRGALTAAVSFPLCAVWGFVFAKLFFVVLIESGVILEWGEWDGLFSLDADTFCFTGGAVGVWLGILLSARITGYKPAASLADRFTLPGTLLIAGLRVAEMELGSIGTGRFIEIEQGSFSLIPVVFNQYGEAHVAVFILEAVAAVIIGLLSLLVREERPGLRFEITVFRLCACQVLLENMRRQTMSWGFVKVEQLLCAVIMMSLMLIACARREKPQGAARFLPAVYLFVCIAAIVGIEFLRQRSPSRFMGMYGGYLMMAAVLCVILFIYQVLALGRRRHPKTNQ
jgi:hypothetical protein